MIPILSSIIVGAGRDGHGVSHLRGFLLSLAYVLGMAVTYAAAGVSAALTGTLLAATLQNPWVLGILAAVFVALSLSMFGFYELQTANLPAEPGIGASRPPEGVARYPAWRRWVRSRR
jgi:thiol:disulfide interchange protein DsbD